LKPNREPRHVPHWRRERAERIETEQFAREMGDRDLEAAAG